MSVHCCFVKQCLNWYLYSESFAVDSTSRSLRQAALGCLIGPFWSRKCRVFCLPKRLWCAREVSRKWPTWLFGAERFGDEMSISESSDGQDFQLSGSRQWSSCYSISSFLLFASARRPRSKGRISSTILDTGLAFWWFPTCLRSACNFGETTSIEGRQRPKSSLSLRLDSLLVSLGSTPWDRALFSAVLTRDSRFWASVRAQTRLPRPSHLVLSFVSLLCAPPVTQSAPVVNCSWASFSVA